MRNLVSLFVIFVFAQAWCARGQEVWTNQTPDILVGLYGNGVFVAGGEVIKISADGRNWTTLQEGPFAYIRTGAFGNNRFLLSTGSLVGWSTNGVQWNYSTDFRALSIMFLNGRFWAVGTPNGDTGPAGIFSSLDGLTWTEAFRTSTPIVAITSAGRSFFAVSSTNDTSRLFTSGDGTTWNEATPLPHHAEVIGALRGIYFVGTRDAGGPFQNLSSTNLIDWHVMTFPTTNSFSMLDFAGGQFRVALGGAIYASPDTVNWTFEAKFDVESLNVPIQRPEGIYLFGWRGWILFSPKVGEWEVISPTPQFYPETLFEVAYRAPNFYAGGSTGIVTSIDGIRWEPSLTNAGAISALVSRDTNLFAFGPGTAFKLQGQGWSPLGMNPKFVPLDVAADSNRFVAVAPHAMFTSSDGVNWSMTFTNAALPVLLVAHGNGRFVAIPTHSPNPAAIMSTDGANWNPVSIGLSGASFAGIVFGNGIFLAEQANDDPNLTPANYADLYSSTDGANWTRITGSPPQPAGRLLFANGLFFLFTTDSVAFSADGLNWEINQANYEIRTHKVPSDVAYGGLRYVCVGEMVVTSARPLSLDFTGATDLDLSVGPGRVDGVTVEESTDLVNWGPVHPVGGSISSGYDIKTVRSVRRFFRAKGNP